MANDLSLNININAITSGFVNAINGVQSSVSGVTELIKGSLDKIKEGFSEVGEEASEYLNGAIESAAKAQTSTIQLQEYLKNQGVAFNNTAGDIEAFTNGITKMSTYSDGEARDALLNLTQNGVKYSDALKSQTALTNLAAGNNMDLSKASDALSQAYSGNYSQLESLNVVTKDQVKNGISYQQVLDAVNSKFGGSAAAQVNSYAGQIKILSNSLDSMKTAIGNALLPMLTKLLEKINSIVTPAADFVKAHAKMAAAILVTATALGTLAGGLTSIKLLTSLLGTDVSAIGEGFGKLKMTFIGVAAVASIIAYAYETNLGGLKTYLDGVFKGISAVFDTFTSDLKKGMSVPQALSDAITKAFGAKLGQQVSQVFNNIKSVFQGMISLVQNLIKTVLIPALELAVNYISNNKENLLSTMTEISGIATKVFDNILKPALQGLISILGNLINFLSSHQEVIKAFFSAMSAAKIIKLITASDNLKDALTTLGGKAISFGSKFGSAFKDSGTVFKGLGQNLSDFIYGPWKLLGNGIKSLPNLISNFSVSGIISKITTPLRSIPSLFSSAFSKIPEILNTFKGNFMNLGNSIIGLGPKILNGIKSAFSIGRIMSAGSKAIGLFTNPWFVLALVIAAAIGAIIANWSKIKSWITEHFGGSMPTTINQFKNVISTAFKNIEQVCSTVWNNIKNVVMQVWAYISPTIIGAVKDIQSFWNQIWPQLQQVFVEVWNVMKVVVAPSVMALYVIISTALGLIKGIWSSVWNVLKDSLKLVWDGITGVIKVAWDIISGVIKVGLDLLTGNWSKAWEDFKSIFSNVWSDLKTLIGNVAKDALNWGKDIISGIINGIKGAVGGLKDAVGNIANTIRSYLHFSVPDEGPLADFDTYMPDMMNGMADGIKNNKHLVTNAIKGLATDMSVGVKYNTVPSISSSIVSNGTSLGKSNNDSSNNGLALNFNGNINLNGYSDVKKFARDLYNIQQDYNRGRGN